MQVQQSRRKVALSLLTKLTALRHLNNNAQGVPTVIHTQYTIKTPVVYQSTRLDRCSPCFLEIVEACLACLF